MAMLYQAMIGTVLEICTHRFYFFVNLNFRGLEEGDRNTYYFDFRFFYEDVFDSKVYEQKCYTILIFFVKVSSANLKSIYFFKKSLIYLKFVVILKFE